MAATEFNDLHVAIKGLKAALHDLSVRYGPATGLLRIQNDIERLTIDVNDLETTPPHAVTITGQPAAEPILVPELRSDEAAWMGAQDEGLGFHSRKRTQ